MPRSLSPSPQPITWSHRHSAIEKAQAAASISPASRPSSPVLSTGKHETSPVSPLNALYVPPQKRQNSYITIGDLFAKFSAPPHLSPPGIVRTSYMTMHDLFVKFRSSISPSSKVPNSYGFNSHGANSHGSNSHGSNPHGSNSHGSMFKRNSTNQKQALMSAPSNQIPAVKYVDQSEASLAAKSVKSDSAAFSRDSASTSRTPFGPPPTHMLPNHSYRQSSSSSASSLALPQAPLMASSLYAQKISWRDNMVWRTQNSTSFSFERLLESLLHVVRDTGHAQHTIQLR